MVYKDATSFFSRVTGATPVYHLRPLMPPETPSTKFKVAIWYVVELAIETHLLMTALAVEE